LFTHDGSRASYTNIDSGTTNGYATCRRPHGARSRYGAGFGSQLARHRTE
jgi:hypothetical protein